MITVKVQDIEGRVQVHQFDDDALPPWEYRCMNGVCVLFRRALETEPTVESWAVPLSRLESVHYVRPLDLRCVPTAPEKT